jgi:hypothetical protein
MNYSFFNKQSRKRRFSSDHIVGCDGGSRIRSPLPFSPRFAAARPLAGALLRLDR